MGERWTANTPVSTRRAEVRSSVKRVSWRTCLDLRE